MRRPESAVVGALAAVLLGAAGCGQSIEDKIETRIHRDVSDCTKDDITGITGGEEDSGEDEYAYLCEVTGRSGTSAIAYVRGDRVIDVKVGPSPG